MGKTASVASDRVQESWKSDLEVGQSLASDVLPVCVWYHSGSDGGQIQTWVGLNQWFLTWGSGLYQGT